MYITGGNFVSFLRNNKYIIIFCTVTIVILSIVIFNNRLAHTSKNKKVMILYSNDEHGSLDNFAKIASLKEKYENDDRYDDVILVSSGDAFSGNPVVDQYIINNKDLRGKPIIDLMNKAGYQLSVLGNHEFDYGQKRLNENIEFANFPLLLANIKLDEDKAILKQPPPYKIIETKQGVKLAFVGIVQINNDGYPSTLVSNLEGLDFLSPTKTVQNYLYLKDKNDVLILLSHNGHSWNLNLARNLKNIDVIIGGHSHTVVQKAAQVEDTLVTQAGSNLDYLGKIILTFDRNNNLIDSMGELIDLDEIKFKKDEIVDIINSYQLDLKDVLNRELNHLNEPIIGVNNIGALMTDALRNSLKIEEMGYEIDIALQNVGGIRADKIYPGAITVGDVYEIEPFGNNVIIYKMTAKQIRNMLAISYIIGNSVDLIPSGLKYEIIVDYKGKLKKIVLKDLDNNEIDNNKLYTVVLNQYVASSYKFTAENEGENIQLKVSDCIINYLENRISSNELKKIYTKNDLNRIDLKITKGGTGQKVAKTKVDISTINKAHASVGAANLMADALSFVLDVDIGAYPSSQLAPNIVYPKNSPLYQKSLDLIYSSFAYHNNVTMVNITGKNLEKMLLKQAKYYKEGPIMTHLSSSARYTVEIKEDKIKDIKIYLNNERLKANQKYSFAINSYVWQFYAEAADYFDITVSQKTEKEILLEYLKEIKIIDSSILEKRVEIIEKNESK